MNLALNRFNFKKDYTNGLFYIERVCHAFTLEDEIRAVKVRKETAVPEGKYEVKFRKELSGLTKRYRKNFSWFKWHLQLRDVPGFNYVYIHRGNTDEHTDGCILVAHTCDLTPQTQDGFVGESTTAFKKIYAKISNALNKKEKVFITIKTL